MIDFTDIKVRTTNPTLLDDTIRQLPGVAAVVIDGSFDGDICEVRVFGGLDFLTYALANQGYGEVVG